MFLIDFFFGFRVHPHNLVGKECKNGVCTVVVSPETMKVQFQNLGIQCVKKRDIESSLRLREQIKVDPFRRKFYSITTKSGKTLFFCRGLQPQKSTHLHRLKCRPAMFSDIPGKSQRRKIFDSS